MVGLLPDQTVRFPLTRQRWRQATFLHYPCDPDAIARHLPDGLVPDLYAGQAWFSITPLMMREVRPVGLPAAPGWSTFPEVNLRTYVRAPDGRDGIWFFRLDCPRQLMVRGMNLVGLRYRYRPAEFSAEPGKVSYNFHGDDLTVRIGARITEQSVRDIFLTGRWNAFTRRGNRLLRFPIAHQPWALHTATASGNLLTAFEDLGLPVLDHQPIVHYSPGVDVRIAAPRLLPLAPENGGDNRGDRHNRRGIH